ncbi:MAG: serine hydrolase domain-containing protein [Planctomycetota bacterium]|jgi:CubicO group peptidase (beta-lactamase class C family)
MKTLHELTLLAGLTAILHAPVGALGGTPDKNADALDRWLQSQVSGGFQGQVLLERDGKVALHRAYGLADDSKGIPATTDSLYYIGSLAKMFTSAVVLQLDAEKKLKLSHKLGRYLENVPEDKAGIKIVHLLSHTSGAVANHPDPLSKLEQEEFLTWFMSSQPAHKPGKKHQYSNVGYSVLAALVARVDGGSFQESIRRRILEPAGMNNTFFVDEIESLGDRAAIGTGPKLAEFHVDGRPQSYGGTWLRIGPGGIVSTAGDLLLWERALRNETILTRKQYKRATKPIKPHKPWGLGWRLSRTTRGTPLHYHDGSLPGFNSLFARYPEENAVIIVLCNRDDSAGPAGKRLSREFFAE